MNFVCFVFPAKEKKKMERRRVAFVGAPEVGKSSVIHQFVSHVFLKDHEPTIEDFFEVQRNGIILEIVDLSGFLVGPEAKFRQEAIALCDVIVYMLSVDCPESLAMIRFFWEEDKRNLPLLLVGNKSDLRWQICPYMLQNIEYELETTTCPVSAKDPFGIDDFFDQIIEKAKSKSEPCKEDEVSTKCCIIV